MALRGKDREEIQTINNVIIDGPAIIYQAWYRTGLSEPSSEIELIQFAKDLTEMVYGFKKRWEPKDFVFAIDDISWRHSYFDFWYRHRIDYFQSKDADDQWVVQHNFKTYRAYYCGVANTWVTSPKTMTNAKVEELDLDNDEKWYKYKGGINDNVRENFPRKVRDSEYWEQLQTPLIYPRYKGSRAKTWPYKTSKKEVREYGEQLLRNLAPLMGARVIKVPRAEADDIAAMWAKTIDPSENAIAVASDQDWDQIGSFAGVNFFTRWDNVGKFWRIKEKNTARYHMWLKIMGGDKGDGIFPAKSANKSVPYTEVSFVKHTDEIDKGKNTEKDLRKLLEASNWDYKAAREKLCKYQHDATFDRNIMLVHLGKTPSKIRLAIWEALHAEGVKSVNPKFPNLDIAGVGQSERRSVTTGAKNWQIQDQMEGIYPNG